MYSPQIDTITVGVSVQWPCKTQNWSRIYGVPLPFVFARNVPIRASSLCLLTNRSAMVRVRPGTSPISAATLSANCLQLNSCTPLISSAARNPLTHTVRRSDYSVFARRSFGSRSGEWKICTFN
jgi:hypothetical protein